MYKYITHGTCSRSITIDVQDDVVRSVVFEGGCHGNTQGVSRLVVGMPVDKVISLLKGIPCQGSTSCPDQLATALMQMKEKGLTK